MRFLLDESADYRLAPYLTDHGHDVTVIARDYPQALSDQAVLAIAQQEGRILIANDLDFGELVFRRGLPHHGVFFLRLGGDTPLAAKMERLQHVLSRHADELDQFLVVTRSGVRVRRTG